jgi:hypothetical protein
MPQYDVRTSSLPDLTRVAVLLDWETARMLCAVQQKQTLAPILFVRDLTVDGDIERAVMFIQAVGKNIRVDASSVAPFFEAFAGKLKLIATYTNGKNRVRFASFDELNAYLTLHSIPVNDPSVSVEVVHDK